MFEASGSSTRQALWLASIGARDAPQRVEEDVNRERALQVVLVLVGAFYSFWAYLLFDDLWHARWLHGHMDVMPMFLSLNAALGPCLLLAVKQPSNHRLMIFYGALSSLA